MLEGTRTTLHLARWLGPWTPDTAMPSGVTRTEHWIPESEVARRPMKAWLYAPAPRTRPRGGYLLAPGLHYAGPADPRMDRFCRVLSGAGFFVLAPFLPDFLELQVKSSLADDLDRALEYLLAHPQWLAGGKPAIFSISFGSLPTFRVISAPHRQDQVGRAIIFGGYADWSKTIEYCLTGQIDGRAHGTRDPLNQPVVFMNLLEHLEGLPDDREALVDAWRRYVYRTWGRPEMKAEHRYKAVAREIAQTLSTPVRDYFFLGCGVEGDGHAACRGALLRSDAGQRLDPRPSFAKVRCPVTLLHGLDDDVIPYTQAEALHAALSPHTESELLLTGLVDHTRSAAKLGAGLRELRTLHRICRILGTPKVP